jgi:hypothetical protein
MSEADLAPAVTDTTRAASAELYTTDVTAIETLARATGRIWSIMARCRL